METKEQKIEKLQKRYIGLSWLVYGTYSDKHTDGVIDVYKQEMEFIEQELKELEDNKGE